MLVGLLTMLLEVLLMLEVDVETVRKWRPLRLVDQLAGTAGTLLFIGHDSVVDIEIVSSQGALFRDHLDMDIVAHDISVGLKPLRSLVWRREVIFALQALMSFDRVLKLELDLGVVR